MYDLAQETADDYWEVEALLDLCFVPGREALSSYRLRDDIAPAKPMCLVARDADKVLAGAIRGWPVRVGGQTALLVGPIAVHPTRQGEGLGAALVFGAMDIAAALGWQRAMLVGDADYYMRFGFTLLPDVEMPPPTNPARVLGRALVPGSWAGVKGRVCRALD
ncbi:MAG: N-acetyltransferase [Rhodobacteraceae bacterium]|nr:N-acetyltransferase [Paracoccaceae bacterium]